MLEDFRHFKAIDLFGRLWEVEFLWQQNAISIRHSDSVDVKFEVTSDDARSAKIIALMHSDLLDLSRKTGHPLTDAWCSRLAAVHLAQMIETGEDMDKTLVTPTLAMLDKHHSSLS